MKSLLAFLNIYAKLKLMIRRVTQIIVVVFVLGIVGFGAYRFLPQIIADETYPLEYVGEINQCGDAFGLDKPLLAALILKESGFNPRAQSHAGAMGLTQVMPATFRANVGRMSEIQGIIENQDPWDPKTNVCVGAGILAGLMAKYGGDWTAALIAYNGGDGAAQRYLAARSTAVLVTETRLYAPKILAARDVYATMYADKFTGSYPPTGGGIFLGGGTAGGPAPAPTLISVPVSKPSEKAREFWKGFAKDVFARFFTT